MEYRKFVDALVMQIKEKTGMGNVFFQKADESLQEDSILAVLGDMEKDSLVFRISARKLYQEYCSACGQGMEAIVNQVADGIIQMKELNANKKRELSQGDYHQLEEFIFVRPVNYERNKRKIQGTVYRVCGDIALAVCIKVAETEGSLMSGYIPMSMVEKWNMDADTVFENALKNTACMLPPKVIDFGKLLFYPDYEGDDLMEPGYRFKESQKVLGICISVPGKINGAVAIFEPGVARRLSDLMGGDLYIAFTSTYEAMVHSAGMIDLECVGDSLLGTVMGYTPEEDILSLHVYRYSRADDRIEMLPISREG